MVVPKQVHQASPDAPGIEFCQEPLVPDPVEGSRNIKGNHGVLLVRREEKEEVRC